ncbi:hypothetical protein JRQ81_015112 [Phrynocephalus forsythii]|uniref:Peptidase inhibitor 16 n=1 Tax=Phrynocephalus forsythii TaxID=171643 RepID=A0A9Q0XYP1_9SAUR|nr:hypothetical protein JRQ81_015112 [Phrynocephalus forsythii]
MAARGRKFGSSRRKDTRSQWGNVQTSPISEEELSQSEIMERIQDTFQEHDGNKKGFITQADMQKLEGIIPWSIEELDLVFRGLDADSKGCLATEDFMAGLGNILNTQRVTREHRKRKSPSAKNPAGLTLEEVDPEEKKCFEAFINQLGADRIFEEESEIWRIWVQLRKDEPDLLGNLKQFLAKMTQLIKKANHEKETLQFMLKKRVADHNKEVRRLYKEMEQQIEGEKQRLQYESKNRSRLCNMEMKKVLDVREQEIQHFLTVQKEQKANTQTAELKQANCALENQLQETLHQLQRTQSHLDAMKDRVAQMLREDRASADLASVTTAASVSRTRVSSIEEGPVVVSVGEEQCHPQKPSGQSSIFKELNEAMAAMSRVSDESHEQPTGDIGLQGEVLLGKTRQVESSQPRDTQQNLSLKGRWSEKDGREKGIPGTLKSQAIFQTEVVLEEPSIYVEGGALERKNNHGFDPGMEVRTPEPTTKGRTPSGIEYPLHSGLTADLEDRQRQRDILVSQVLIQHESQRQALKSSNISQTPERSTDSEQGEKQQPPALRTRVEKMPSHMLGKDTGAVHFPPRTALLRLHVGHKSETCLVQRGQFKNTPDLGMQAQTAELLEVQLSEKRREGKIGISKAIMDEKTKLIPERKDCQVTKEISQGTRALSPQPDHLYNVLFVGDTNVGKTSFLCRLQDDSFGTHVTTTVGIDYRIKTLYVDDKWFALQLWDTAGQERYHSLTKQFFRKADGIVLMYDIASEHSFADVKYWLNCIQEGAGNGVVVLLLGNKTDCTAERRISINDGESLAKEYGLSFCECSAASGHNVTESMVKLASERRHLMVIQFITEWQLFLPGEPDIPGESTSHVIHRSIKETILGRPYQGGQQNHLAQASVQGREDFSPDNMELSASEPSIYDKLSETIDLVRQTAYQCGMSEKAIEKFIRKQLKENEPQRVPPRYPLLMLLYKGLVTLGLILLTAYFMIQPYTLSSPEATLSRTHAWGSLIRHIRLLPLPITKKYMLEKCHNWWGLDCRQNASLAASCSCCCSMRYPEATADLGQLSVDLHQAQPLLIKTGQYRSYAEMKHFQFLYPELTDFVVKEDSAEGWSTHPRHRLPLHNLRQSPLNKTQVLNEMFPVFSSLFPKSISLKSCYLINRPRLQDKTYKLQSAFVVGSGQLILNITPSSLCREHCENLVVQMEAGDIAMELSWCFTSEDKKLIVDLHNQYRSKVDPPASDMLKMSWDPALEAFAKDYATKCIWEHNKERGRRGENLFAMSGDLDVTAIVENWHDEYQYYNISTLACQEGQMCGHYTQVVWARSERVGCGTVFCKTIENLNDTDMHLVVCNYEPPGNVKGKKPYEEGKPCSMCPDGYSCEDSLCASSADEETTMVAPELPTSILTVSPAAEENTTMSSMLDTSESPQLGTEAESEPMVDQELHSSQEPQMNSLVTTGAVPFPEELTPSPATPEKGNKQSTSSDVPSEDVLTTPQATMDSLVQPLSTGAPVRSTPKPPPIPTPRSVPKPPAIPKPPPTVKSPPFLQPPSYLKPPSYPKPPTIPKKPPISKTPAHHRLAAYSKAIKRQNNFVQSSSGKAESMSVCLPCLGCKQISHPNEIKAALKELTFRYPYAPCFSSVPHWQSWGRRSWGSALRKARPYWLNSS